MNLSVRGKLLAISLLLIGGASGAAGLLLESQIRTALENHHRERLVGQATLIRTALLAAPSQDTATLEPLLQQLGSAADLHPRLTTPATQPTPDFPQVTASATELSVQLPYAPPSAEPRVLIVGASLAEVRQEVQNLRYILFGATVLGLLGALFMSTLAAHLMSRALEPLLASARGMLRGEQTNLVVSSQDEFGRLAHSFNRVANDLRNTFATLGQERDRFQTMLDSMREAVLAVDGERKITLVNPEALALLELDSSAVGMPLIDAIRLPALNDLVADSASNATSTEFTVGSERREVLARAAPLKEAGGAVVVMHDISEMRHLERVRRDFVANVSHELRTPVSVIRANSETLISGAMHDAERAKLFVEALHRNAERLSNILSDLLQLSRMEAGHYPVSIEPLVLNEVVSSALEPLRASAVERDVTLHVELPRDLSVLADSTALDHVLFNLLDNAIKYTSESGSVKVRARRATQGVRIEIQDDGPGIPPQHRPRIFERFYRVDPGRSRAQGGTGLGLAIVKHLMEIMNGEVGFEPAAPRGSIFWVQLPESLAERETAHSSPRPAASVDDATGDFG